MLEILSKQAHVQNLKALPQTASVDRAFLMSLFLMEKFDDIAEEDESVSNLTDDRIKLYVESLVKHEEEVFVDHEAMAKVLADFSMAVKIANPDAKITTYCAYFFDRLERIGCGYFRKQNPKKPSTCSCPLFSQRPSSANSTAALSSSSRLTLNLRN